MTDSRGLASVLDDATRTATATPQLTATTPLTIGEAYDVQHAGVALRMERGEAVIGVNLGFTSKAKALQMGVSEPDPTTAAIEVAPALEIIDSRYRDFKFSLEDVVADNTSAAGVVVGPWRSLESARSGLDLGNLGVVLEVDGIVETGSTAAILGHPLRALSAVKRMARQHGHPLPAESLILAGAATALGRVSVTIRGQRD